MGIEQKTDNFVSFLEKMRKISATHKSTPCKIKSYTLTAYKKRRNHKIWWRRSKEKSRAEAGHTNVSRTKYKLSIFRSYSSRVLHCLSILNNIFSWGCKISFVVVRLFHFSSSKRLRKLSNKYFSTKLFSSTGLILARFFIFIHDFWFFRNWTIVKKFSNEI